MQITITHERIEDMAKFVEGLSSKDEDYNPEDVAMVLRRCSQMIKDAAQTNATLIAKVDRLNLAQNLEAS